MKWNTLIRRVWKLFAGFSVCLGFFLNVGSVRSKIEGLYPFLEATLPLLGLASACLFGCWILSIGLVFWIDNRPAAKFGSCIKEIEKYRDTARIAFTQIITAGSLTQFAHTEFYPSMLKARDLLGRFEIKCPKLMGGAYNETVPRWFHILETMIMYARDRRLEEARGYADNLGFGEPEN